MAGDTKKLLFILNCSQLLPDNKDIEIDAIVMAGARINMDGINFGFILFKLYSLFIKSFFNDFSFDVKIIIIVEIKEPIPPIAKKIFLSKYSS